MQAHYAGAVPLSVLKREQDRILAELGTTNRRIDDGARRKSPGALIEFPHPGRVSL